jgi:hypothetical protein
MKHRIFAIINSLMGLIVFCWMSVAAAVSMDVVDAKAISTVVQKQLDAFANDDAKSAFALSGAATQIQIGSPDNFLRLIKKYYYPIYRHQVAYLLMPEIIDGNIIQVVRLTDHNNHVWVAIYRMQRAADGNWKIDGCQLLETTSIST